MDHQTETPVPPKRYSPIIEVPVTLPDYIIHGITDGVLAGTVLATLYALALALAERDFSFVLVVGFLATLLVGTTGGAICGSLFRWWQRPKTVYTALGLGAAGGIILLAPPTIAVLYLFFPHSPSASDIFEFMLIWGFPCMLALLGFAWVGYRLNLLVPRAKNPHI